MIATKTPRPPAAAARTNENVLPADQVPPPRRVVATRRAAGPDAEVPGVPRGLGRDLHRRRAVDGRGSGTADRNDRRLCRVARRLHAGSLRPERASREAARLISRERRSSDRHRKTTHAGPITGSPRHSRTTLAASIPPPRSSATVPARPWCRRRKPSPRNR